jgi:hypothetical protein
LAALVKRHPALRAELTLRVFWKPAHAWFLLALAGALTRRRALQLPTLLGWMAQHRSSRQGLRAGVRDAIELPGWAAIDLAEVLSLVRGSLRHGALLL